MTILKNIALVTYALLNLFSGARGSNGWLSKAALARCLPLDLGPKSREQRLYRFLANPRFTPELMIPLLVALACGTRLPEPVPLILDQTTIRGIPTLLIGLVFEGRVLPVLVDGSHAVMSSMGSYNAPWNLKNVVSKLYKIAEESFDPIG